MRKSFFIAMMSMAVLFTTSIYAQSPAPHHPMGRQKPNPEQIAQRMTERMSEELQLSPEQSEKLYELNLNRIKKHQADKQAHHEQMQADRAKSDESLQQILTPEQYAEWQKIKAERKEHRGRAEGQPCMQNKECDKAKCTGSKSGKKRGCNKSVKHTNKQ